MMQERTPRGPADPGRRDRIIEAAITVVGRDGVAGTTHRRVAAEAGVPVGSTTYYFATLDDLIEAALAKTVDDYREMLESRAIDLSPGDQDRLIRVLTDLIMEGLTSRREQTTVEYVLYLAAVTNPRLREQASACTDLLVAALAPAVGRSRATMLAATFDGLIIRGLVSPRPLARREVRSVLKECI